MKFRNFSKVHVFIFAIITIIFLWQFAMISAYAKQITSDELYKELKTVSNTLEGIGSYNSYISTINVSKLKDINEKMLRCTSEYAEESLAPEIGNGNISTEQISALTQHNLKGTIDFAVYDMSGGKFISEDRYLGGSSLSTSVDFERGLSLLSGGKDIVDFSVSKEGRTFNANMNRIGTSRYAVIGVMEQNNDVSKLLEDDVAMVFKPNSIYSVYFYDSFGQLEASNREAEFLKSASESKAVYDVFVKNQGKVYAFETLKNGKRVKQLGYGIMSGGSLLVVSKDYVKNAVSNMELSALMFAITFVNFVLSMIFSYCLATNKKDDYSIPGGVVDIRYKNVALMVIVVIFLCSFNGLVSTEVLKIRGIESLKRDIKSEVVNFNFFESIYKNRILKYVKSNEANANATIEYVLRIADRQISKMDLATPSMRNAAVAKMQYIDEECGIKMYAVSKNDLLTNSNYSYILDKFKNTGEISFTRYDILSGEDYKAVRVVGFFYEPKLDSVIIAEKTLSPAYIDYGYITRTLFSATSNVNRGTIGTVLVVSKSGRIDYDNKHAREGTTLEIYDTDHSPKPISSLRYDDNSFVEISMGPPKYKELLAYVVYDNAEDIYYIDYVDKDAYSHMVDGLKMNLVKWTTVILECAIIALLAIITNYALKLLE